METITSGACIVGRVRVKDPVRWAVYLDAIPSTIAPFGGTLVVRGHDARVLAGAAGEPDMVVIHFPSMEHVDRWYRSDAYQALIPIRDAAADVVITAYTV